jgi:hypothetical protein
MDQGMQDQRALIGRSRQVSRGESTLRPEEGIGSVVGQNTAAWACTGPAEQVCATPDGEPDFRAARFSKRAIQDDIRGFMGTICALIGLCLDG